MKKSHDPRLVFLDIETTGLSPESDVILEVGIVVTTPSLTVVGYPWGGAVCTPNAESLIESEYVRAMHKSSGLLNDVLLSGASMAEVETAALRFLMSLDFAPGTATMAGFGPHFDRAFLRAQMPALEAFFDYRMIDVSTLRGLARRLVNPDIDKKLRGVIGEPKHRAVADSFAAISELELYCKFLLDLDGFRKAMQEF